MLCPLFIGTMEQVKNCSRLLRRYVRIQNSSSSRNIGTTRCNRQGQTNKGINDEPIKFSTSNAASWKAVHSRIPECNTPWFQGIIVSGSMAVFLLYFFLLREENDIDQIVHEMWLDINNKRTTAIMEATGYSPPKG